MAAVADASDRLGIVTAQNPSFLVQHRLELAEQPAFLGQHPAQVLPNIVALHAHCACACRRSCSSCSNREAMRSGLTVYCPDSICCCTAATRALSISGVSCTACDRLASARADCVICTLSVSVVGDSLTPAGVTGLLTLTFSMGLPLPGPIDPPSNPLIRFGTKVSLRSSNTHIGRQASNFRRFSAAVITGLRQLCRSARFPRRCAARTCSARGCARRRVRRPKRRR